MREIIAAPLSATYIYVKERTLKSSVGIERMLNSL